MTYEDEMLILRDAYRRCSRDLDWVETEDWQRPFVDRLVADGTLIRSLRGHVRRERRYRIPAHRMEFARQCHDMFEDEMRDLRRSVESGLAALLAIGMPDRAYGV